jgi:hypothetical protein
MDVEVRRMAGDLNHIFLSQQIPNGQESGSSHELSCKCVHISYLFLWGTRTLMIVVLCRSFRDGSFNYQVSKPRDANLEEQ